jgi:hypothetical protein
MCRALSRRTRRPSSPSALDGCARLLSAHFAASVFRGRPRRNLGQCSSVFPPSLASAIKRLLHFRHRAATIPLSRFERKLGRGPELESSAGKSKSAVHCIGLGFMLLSVCFLIAPSLYDQILSAERAGARRPRLRPLVRRGQPAAAHARPWRTRFSSCRTSFRTGSRCDFHRHLSVRYVLAFGAQPERATIRIPEILAIPEGQLP